MKIKHPGLTPFEIQQPTWKKLKAFYEMQLAELRSQLENPAHEQRTRDALCWQIKTIKDLLAFETLALKNVAGADE